MISKQRIITAAATFAIAGGSGYLMQNGDALASKFSTADVVNIPTVSGIVAPNLGPTLASGFPTPPIDSVVPSGFQSIPTAVFGQMVATNTPFTGEFLTDPVAPMFYPEDCKVTLTALPSVGAMVSLELNAPCYQNQRIEIAHAGLEFADTTAVDGSYSVLVPALGEYDPFSVNFMDGRGVEAKTLMLTIDGYDRAVINWSGPHDLNIHAYETGAEFGGADHIWANAPGDPDAGAAATGGFLIRLGNPNVLAPKLAEVYSYPRERGEAHANVELIVEAEINGQTCGIDLTGTAIQISAAGVVEKSDLSLAFPTCDGENGFLVLNNLLHDLKIARN